MRIIDGWQYRYIEKCLYSYYEIKNSKLETEMKMAAAIKEALDFFVGSCHETMMQEFYFSAAKYRKKLSKAGHYNHVCETLLHTEAPNGYVIRREIVYRIAMNCYALGIFKINLFK